jgi:hypothetical protein
MESDLGRIDVEIADSLIAFTRTLQRAGTLHDAVAGLLEADARLDVWQHERVDPRQERDGFLLPFGIEVRFPRQFGLNDRGR